MKSIHPNRGAPLKCLLAASEATGFAKTGGLADVAASLPRALSKLGIQTSIILPLYRCIRNGKEPIRHTDHLFRIPVGSQTFLGRIWTSRIPNSDIPVYLIEQPEFFERDDPKLGTSLYQYTGPDGSRLDYPDNSSRFIFFSRAVLETIRAMELWPDLLHLNDWQTGLVPVYLRELVIPNLRGELRYRYEQIRTIFTIHNLGYQGLFWHYDMPLTGLPWEVFQHDKLEFYGKMNFLKGGIVYSDRLTTVSPTYAREIQTQLLGCGLQNALLQRTSVLSGIVNGIDSEVWDPSTDSFLAERYDSETVTSGKAACKEWLQRQFQLEVQPRTPLFGVISRLAEQKGIELILQIAPTLLNEGMQLVVLGEGDQKYHQALAELKRNYSHQVGLSLRQDEEMAHQIEAGVDLFLMPSKYEPCGLNQLYSLRYGTIPIVRATGGLADTVIDCTPDQVQNGRATGFTFVPFLADSLMQAVQRALRMYRDAPTLWKGVQKNGMTQDWSWERSAKEYEKLYRLAISEF